MEKVKGWRRRLIIIKDGTLLMQFSTTDIFDELTFSWPL